MTTPSEQEYTPPAIIHKDEGTIGASDIEVASNSAASTREDEDWKGDAKSNVKSPVDEGKRLKLMVVIFALVLIIAVVLAGVIGFGLGSQGKETESVSSSISRNDVGELSSPSPANTTTTPESPVRSESPTLSPSLIVIEQPLEDINNEEEARTIDFLKKLTAFKLNEDKPFAPYSTWEEISDDVTASLQHYSEFLIQFAASYIFHPHHDIYMDPMFYFIPMFDPYALVGNNPVVEEIMWGSTSNARTGGANNNQGADAKKKERKVPDSFGTNNQEAGVDESDTVKSDGSYIYTAFGADVYVLDASNSKNVSRINVPPIEATTESGSTPTNIAMARQSGSSSTSSQLQCVPRVMGMLLAQPSQLAVMVTDACYKYGEHEHNYNMYGYYEPFNITQTSSRVLMYDTSNPDSLSLTSEQHFGGVFHSARMIDSTIHMVTLSSETMYSDLGLCGVPMLESKMTEEEFIAAAKVVVNDNIQKTVSNFITEKQNTYSSPGQILRATTLQSSFEGRTFLNQDPTGTLAIISSFDTATPNQVEATAVFLPGASSGFMTPGEAIMYMSSSKLIISGYGFSADEKGEIFSETFFLAFNIDGNSVGSASAATVEGYLPGRLGVDHHVKNGVDYLRVASMTFNNEFTFEMTDDFNQFQTSSRVSIFEIPPTDANTGMMKLVGHVDDIGIGEEIYAVRFSGDRGYVVTFLYTDPVHTLDLSNPAEPKIAGILEITGYSAYLHEISENLVLGIGQDIHNVTGAELGIQVSLYDVSDFEKPTLIQTYIQEQGDNGYSSSAVSFDFNSFRYIQESNLLLLPARVETFETSDFFDGFYVFSVNATAGIEKLFSVDHASPDNTYLYYEEYCWHQGSLHPRSLVIGGNLITFKVNEMMTYNISSHEETEAPYVFPTETEYQTFGEDCLPIYYLVESIWF